MKKLFVFLFCSLLVLGSTFSVAHAMTAPAPSDGSVGYDYLYRQLEALQQQINEWRSKQNIGGGTSGSSGAGGTSPNYWVPLSVVPTDNNTQATIADENGTLSVINPDGQTYKPGDSVVIRWMSSGFIDGEKTLSVYKLSTLIETISKVIPVTANSYSWTIPSNFAAGNYFIKIKDNTTSVMSAADEGLFSVNPTPAVLTTPTLTTTPSKYQIKISWNAVTGANRYVVRQYLYTGQTVYEGPTSPFTDDGLDCNKTYKYTIQVFGANGVSSPESQQYSAKTLSCTIADPVQKNITIIAPDGNTQKPGDSMIIRWMSSGLTSGSATMSVYKGTTLVSIISKDISVTANSHSWTIPSDFAAGNYHITLKDNETGVTSAFDEGLFNVNTPANTSPKITVLSPNGGETFIAGQQIIVKWKTENISINENNIWMFLRGNNGDQQYDLDLTTSRIFNDGSRSIVIPSNVSQGKFKIGVNYIKSTGSDDYKTFEDLSDNYFTITSSNSQQAPKITVLSPKGGETYKIGSTVAIKWKAENLPTIAKNKVFLSIVRYENGIATEISGGDSSVLNTGSYSLKIKNDTKLGLYKLRVTPNCPEDSVLTACQVYGESAAVFEIISAGNSNNPMKIVKPNGGDKLEIGKPVQISWAAGAFKNNKNADVQVSLVSMRDSTEAVITTMKNTATSYKWTIPMILDTMNLGDITDPIYKVRVTISDSTGTDNATSKTAFSILDKRANDVKVLLSKDTPKSRDIKLGETNAEFLNFDIKNNGKEDIVITGVKLNGTFSSANLQNIYVYDDSTLVGSGMVPSNTNGLQLSISSPVTVDLGVSKTLTVKADLGTDSGSVKQKINIGVEKLTFKIGEKNFEVNVGNVKGNKMTIVNGDTIQSPSIKVLSPVAGGNLVVGNTYKVSWMPLTGDFDSYRVWIRNKETNDFSQYPSTDVFANIVPKSKTSVDVLITSDFLNGFILNSGKTEAQLKGKYFVVVQAIKTGDSSIPKIYGESDLFDIAQKTPTPTTLSAPTNLTAAAVSENAIRITWGAVSGANGYRVRRNGLIQNSVSDPMYYDSTNLQCNTNYSYSVEARRNGVQYSTYDYSSPSAPVTVKTNACGSDTSAFSTPTISSATVSGKNVMLSWNAVPGATAYNIYRDLPSVAKNSAQYLDWANGVTTYTDTTMCSGKTGQVTYVYYIDAYAGTAPTVTQRSARSSGVTATMNCGASALSAPTDLTGTAVSGIAVQLKWTGVSDANGYRIWRNGSIQNSVSDPSYYDDKSLQCDTTYTYGVEARKNGVQYSTYVYSPTTQVTVKTKACDATSLFAPTGVTGSAVSQTSNLIRWNAVTGADGYNIYKLGTLLARTLKGTLLWQDERLQCGTTHQYSVEAFKYDASWNVVGSGNISPTISVQTLGCGSANPFSIQVLSPNGGQTYKSGDIVNILWKTSGYGAGNSIALSIYKYRSDNNYYGVYPVFGETVSNIIGADGTIQDDGTYQWTISSSVAPGTYVVWISSAVGVRDISDAPFTISSGNVSATLLDIVQAQLEQIKQVLLNLR